MKPSFDQLAKLIHEGDLGGIELWRQERIKALQEWRTEKPTSHRDVILNAIIKELLGKETT